MLSETNGIGSKYQPGYSDELQLLMYYFMSIPENGEFILVPKGCFSIEFSYFY